MPHWNVKVTKERISIGNGNEMTTIEYSYEDGQPNEESYVVLRAKFDKWLAEEAEKKGLFSYPMYK